MLITCWYDQFFIIYVSKENYIGLHGRLDNIGEVGGSFAPFWRLKWTIFCGDDDIIYLYVGLGSKQFDGSPL